MVTPLGFVGQFRISKFSWFSQICLWQWKAKSNLDRSTPPKQNKQTKHFLKLRKWHDHHLQILLVLFPCSFFWGGGGVGGDKFKLLVPSRVKKYILWIQVVQRTDNIMSNKNYFILHKRHVLFMDVGASTQSNNTSFLHICGEWKSTAIILVILNSKGTRM